MITIQTEKDRYQFGERLLSEEKISFVAHMKQRFNDGFEYAFPMADSFSLIYIITGEGYADNGKKVFKKSDLIFFPKYKKSSIKITKQTELYHIWFNYTGSNAFFNGIVPEIIHATHEISSLLQTFFMPHREAVNGVREAILLMILNEVALQHNSKVENLTLFKKTYFLIEESAKRSVTVSEISEALGYSREHLSRVFKSISGHSINDQIVSARLWEIEQLCKIPKLSTSNIAQQLDFGSAELLCKFFKYHKKMSITEYRMKLFASTKK